MIELSQKILYDKFSNIEISILKRKAPLFKTFSLIFVVLPRNFSIFAFSGQDLAK